MHRKIVTWTIVAMSAFAFVAPAGWAQSNANAPCVAPAPPAIPSPQRVLTLSELNAFAEALMRHQSASNRYLHCLDQQLTSARLSGGQRAALLSAYNAAAPESARLWGAYEDASNRFREASIAAAKTAPRPQPPVIVTDQHRNANTVVPSPPQQQQPIQRNRR
jgi:hypothetical protein